LEHSGVFSRVLDSRRISRGSLSQFLVLVETGESRDGAFVPDFPGRADIPQKRRESLNPVREGIVPPTDAVRETGDPGPPPVSTGEVVEANAA
jgi:hypothetical protein